MAVVLFTCPSCGVTAVAESKNGKPVFCPECGFAHTPPRPAAEVTSWSWYYARGNEKVGPVSTEQLLALFSAGLLDPSARLWPKNGAPGASVELRAVLTLLGHDKAKRSSLPDRVSDRTRQQEVGEKQPPSEPASVPDWLADVRIPEKSSPAERPRPSTTKPATPPVLNVGRAVDPQASGATGGGTTIVFQCPVCQTQLKAAPEQAGAKLNCPKCNQRLQIPQPPINRTILGTLPPKTEMRRAAAPVATLVSSPSIPPLPQPAQESWSYVRNKQQVGPVSFQQLQQLAAAGQLAPSDMVHRDGMAKWVAANSVPGLFPVTTTGPANLGSTGAPSLPGFKGIGQNRKLLVEVMAAGIIVLVGVGLVASLLLALVLWPKSGPTPSPEQRTAVDRMAALPTAGKTKKREQTLAYWKAFIQILQDENKRVGKDSSGDEKTQSYKRLAVRFAELPVLNVDEELVQLINQFSKNFLDLAAANDEAVKNNAKINFLDYAGNEIVHSLATGKPGTYYREFNKEAKVGREKMEAIMQRLRDNTADFFKMRATLTQRYEIEFPLLK